LIRAITLHERRAAMPLCYALAAALLRHAAFYAPLCAMPLPIRHAAFDAAAAMRYA